MAVMRSVVLTTDRNIELLDRPEPIRRADQVIVDIDLCGICGSDLHSPDLPQVYRGGFTLGHEASGVLSWVGDEVEGWTAGQRVAINPNGNVDGTCEYCRTGHPNFCRQATMETALGLQMDGGLAPRMAAFPGSLRAVPTGMSRYAAAWVEPTATALRAVNLAGDLTGADVLVTGGGPIGQLALRLSKLQSLARLTLVEPSHARRSVGAASGADASIDSAAARRELGDARVDVAIEASGNGGALELAVDALKPGGILVIVGGGHKTGLDPTSVLLKELTVRGSFVYNDEFDGAIALLAEGAVAVDDLTSHVSSLEASLNAFDSLRSASTMKVLISPHE
jgi:threonine dehydrogenase-like Zn-dependent dehydrogenase